MALRLKGVDYDVVPCSPKTKPQWLLDEVGGKMPCVCHGGVLHVETSEILAWIDEEFPDPPLAVPAEFKNVLTGIFPAIAAYTKNMDGTKDGDLKLSLQVAFTRLRNHLFSVDGGFLCGAEPTLLDCDLLSKLFVVEHATAHYKGFSLADFAETDELRMYYARGSALEAFFETAYPGDVCIQGWGEARSGK